jgi:hypothetical protein
MKDSKLKDHEMLVLKYDEASELFSAETLSAMQMAQVNGGAPWPTI